MMLSPKTLAGCSAFVALAAAFLFGCSGSSSTPAASIGCGTSLLEIPDDPSVRGPWKVGVRTAKVGRLTVEVAYPAEPGSEAGVPEATYDIRDFLPPSERSKVPDDASPAVGPIGGNLFRGVPLDGAHGPYPIVINIHGTASFRIANGSTLAHWASRGFVVLSADYPGLFLADQLCAATMPPPKNGTTPGCTCAQTGKQDVAGDVKAQLEALASPSGDLAFLADHIDVNRVGISGHSQGGCVAAGLSTLPHVEVVIPMTGSLQVLPSPSLKSLMYIAGIDDNVIGFDIVRFGNTVCQAPILVPGQEPPSSNKDAYLKSPGPPDVKKRLVGITGGGHLVPTDLCQTNAQGRNAVQEAEHDGVCGIDQAVYIGLPGIFDCGTIDLATGVKDVNYASTAALEETLLCEDRSAAFENIKTAEPTIGDFEEAQ